jgi:hypothetical protein
MAHYREGALERLRSLDRELAAIAMGLALADWEEGFLQQLQRDRWFRPGAMQDRQQPCLERRAGEFVGYGGRFAEPPVVIRRGDSLILQSGTERYELHADAYGATLQPVVEAPVGAGIILPVGYRLDGAVLIGPGLRAAFDQYGQITSAACSADTLVLTHAWSHAATLVSLPQPT